MKKQSIPRLKLIGWLLSLLKPYSLPSTASVFLGFASVASSVGLLATASYLISAASLQPSIAELQVAIVGVRFFGLSRGLFRYLERLCVHSVNFRLLASLRAWLYWKLEPLAPAGLSGKRAGSLLGSVTGSLDVLENFYVRGVVPALTSILTILAAGVWLAFYDPTLAIAWLISAAVLGFLFPAFLQGFSRSPSAAMVHARRQLEAWLVDHLQGLPDLLSFNQTQASMEEALSLQKKYDRAQKRLSLLQGIESAASTLVVNGSGLVLLILAIPLVNHGQLDRLLLAVIVIGGMAAFESLQALPGAGRLLGESLEEARRLHEIANQPGTLPDHAGNPSLQDDQGIPLNLNISNLCFIYPAHEKPTLDGLSLDLPAGQHAALLGASGAGKSTILNLLLRFWEYSNGSITLGEKELRHWDPVVLRSKINCLTARPHIFNNTLRRNLLMAAPNKNDEQLWQALEASCLEEFAASLPEGLETRLGEGGARLSAGERQRLALARFFLRDGLIWVLDEPTAHLDALTARRVRRQLLQAAGGRAVLWITHDLAGLEDMDWIYLLHNGCITEQGTPSEMKAAGGRYARLLALHRDSLETRPEGSSGTKSLHRYLG